MKKELLTRTATVLIVMVVSLAGCKSTPENIIAMTTAMEGEVTFWMAGTGEAVIDWGDGSTLETVTLSAYDKYLNSSHRHIHTFPDTTSRTIAIAGQNIVALECYDMELTALDVTKNTVLTYLHCSSNQLANLDVSKNTGLTELYCYGNRLTSLDVNKNIALTELFCYDNRLTGLDISKNTAMTDLWCGENQLTADGLNALFGTLHANTGDKTIYIEDNPGTSECDRTIATDKGWTVND